MIEQSIQVKNLMGLHARPSAQFVKLASKFECSVELAKNGFIVNGKSILGVMSLAAERGSILVVKTAGEQEQEANDSLIQLIDSFVNEDETSKNEQAQ